MNNLDFIAPTILAVIGFLIRSYFASMNKDIQRLGENIAKLEAKLDPVHNDLKSSTIELIKVQQELKAVWKFIDAPKRASER